MKHVLFILAAASAVAAGLVAAAADASGQGAKSAPPPSRQIALLERDNARLTAANRRLQAYSPSGIAAQLVGTKGHSTSTGRPAGPGRTATSRHRRASSSPAGTATTRPTRAAWASIS